MAQQYHDAIIRRLGLITDLGTDALQNTQNLAAQQQARMAAERAAQEQASMFSTIRNGQNQQGPSYSTPSYGGGGRGAWHGNGKDTFENFLHAIAGRESGGNYNARNASSGAMGKYQIMPGNIQGSGGWDKQILGYNITPQQFMHSPQLQEAIGQGMLKRYYNQWGPGGAAVAWYAGPGRVPSWLRNHNSNTYNRPQGAYSSINAYAQGILRSMGLL